MSERLRLWHGGVPGLRVGELITPGHERKHHDGCPWCEARRRQADGGDAPAIDPLPLEPDRVYLSTDRDYARYHASLWGRGDLYRVEPVGELRRSTEDTFECYTAPQARVVAVYDRAVLLTWSQRRSLMRKWAAADKSHFARLAADARQA